MKRIIISLFFIGCTINILLFFLKNNQIKKSKQVLHQEQQHLKETQKEEFFPYITNSSKNNPTKILKIQDKEIFKTYKDNRYNLIFQYPKNFNVVPEEKCGWILIDDREENKCLASFKFFPLAINPKYTPTANFWLIKDLTSVNIGGHSKKYRL